MDIIRKYEGLVRLKRWTDALPVIEEIVQRAPQIATSWFNHGVCLDEVGRHGEAAEKFLRAYELDPTDYGAQYRVFRSLFLARQYDRFLAFAKSECKANPEVLDALLNNEQFSILFERPEFREFKIVQGR
jgi:tetratricopeptide (TPR) repeat protein